jgi:hypothetical protein
MFSYGRYLFRNAEYVVTLQQLLNIKSRSLEEYKRVFDEIDKDSSGFIEVRFFIVCQVCNVWLDCCAVVY